MRKDNGIAVDPAVVDGVTARSARRVRRTAQSMERRKNVTAAPCVAGCIDRQRV